MRRRTQQLVTAAALVAAAGIAAIVAPYMDPEVAASGTVPQSTAGPSASSTVTTAPAAEALRWVGSWRGGCWATLGWRSAP